MALARLLSAIRMLIVLACTSLPPTFLQAQQMTPTTGIDLPVLGKVKPRAASAIPSSSWWSVGGETIDRDFTVYEHYKGYLGPLGAKSIRLQAGWAKCEKQPGVYSWEWLDAIVDDAIAQGVRPWLELNYGNPVYKGGGDPGLRGGFPSSPEAIAAWDRWARALVMRYKDRVHEWEVWNEPDINRSGTAPVEAYVDLYIRTATMVRGLQPNSRLWALGLANNLDYADQFLAGLQAKGRLELVDAITIHGYPRNPDDTSNIDRLRAVIAKYGHPIAVRQGETGAPSRYQEDFALQKITWTETLQAKWNLRRMLAHRAKDVPFNLFQMSDMHYYWDYRSGPQGAMSMNYKGLLGTNPDQTISHAKPAYYAAQTVFTVFDDTLKRIPEYAFTTTALRGLALSGYQRQTGGHQVVALWFNDAPPGEGNGFTRADVTLPAGRFTDVVLVDVRTSTVHSVPKDRWTQNATGVTFRGLPIYDAPILIAERSTIQLASGNR